MSNDRRTIVQILRESAESHGDDANAAYELFSSFVDTLPRVPGMATVDRLLVRCACGRSIEEAAAKEYLYRWNLALSSHGNWQVSRNTGGRSRWNSGAFGVPHSLGL